MTAAPALTEIACDRCANEATVIDAEHGQRLCSVCWHAELARKVLENQASRWAWYQLAGMVVGLVATAVVVVWGMLS